MEAISGMRTVWFTPSAFVQQSAEAETHSADLILDMTAWDTPRECVPTRRRPVAKNVYVDLKLQGAGAPECKLPALIEGAEG